jgi:protoporphyrinogen/coproporphyrinogen III oxidase
VTRRVVVVGGGVTGLTAAFRLLRDAPSLEVLLLEANTEPGGKIRSATVGGVRLEAGPDSLLARKPWAVDLCRELGLGDDLVPAAAGTTQIWSGTRLLPFPSGPFGISTDPMELFRWPGMSYSAKVRAAGDLVLPRRRSTADESLGALLRRRLGDGATDALVAPLLGGLLGGDVDRLSVDATFPELAQWEREHGSLMRGARAMAAARRPAAVGGHGATGPAGASPPPMFLRLRGGLEDLTRATADALGPAHMRTGTSVTDVRRAGDGFVVAHDGGEEPCDAVIVGTPAFLSADVLESVAPDASAGLRAIPYASTAVALLVYPEGSDASLPDTSGFIAPRGRLPMTAATVISRKWPDEALGGRAVLRCFIGAAGAEEDLAKSDDDLLAGAADALAHIYGLPARPEAAEVVRWPRAMPQYAVGHLDRVAAIEAALPAGVFVAGQAFRGVGIPDCVRQGSEAAERVREVLSV